MSLAGNHPVLTRIRQAGQAAGRNLEFCIAGGGSDANIFNSYGLPTAIVATGMIINIVLSPFRHDLHVESDKIAAYQVRDLLHLVVSGGLL